MTAPTSPTEPEMNYDDDEAMPPPDMELRRLAIKAGLTQPTPLDTFHDMAGALGFRQAGSAEARIAALEARVREVESENAALAAGHCEDPIAHPHGSMVCGVVKRLESDLAAARVTIGELVWGLKPFAESVGEYPPFDKDCRRAAALVARHQAQQ